MNAVVRSYAIVWREGNGGRYTGRLEILAGGLHLEGRSPNGGRRSRQIDFGDLSSVRIGRVESERISGHRTLVLERERDGPLFVLGLSGLGVLHELADLVGAAIESAKRT
jgi:hypothetical protein